MTRTVPDGYVMTVLEVERAGEHVSVEVIGRARRGGGVDDVWSLDPLFVLTPAEVSRATDALAVLAAEEHESARDAASEAQREGW